MELPAPESPPRELTLITEHLPALISWVGADARYRFVNRAYIDFFGHPREEIIGRHMREVLGDATWSVIAPYVERVLAGERVEYDARLPYKYGGPRDVLATYVPHRDERGEVDSFFVLVHDITERRGLELKLRDAEHRMANILENVPEGYYAVDREWKLTYINAEAERYFGRDRGTMLGLPIYDAIAGFAGSPYEAMLREASERDAPVSLEAHGLVRPERLIDVRAYPTSDGVAVFFRDITERRTAEEKIRRSEHRFQSLVAGTNAIVWRTDASGSFIERQKKWESYTGQPWPEHSGRGWMAMIHPDERERIAASWAQATEAKAPFETEGHLWNAENRSYRAFITSVVPLLRDDGTVDEWIGLTHDVEDSRHAADVARFLSRADYELASSLDVMVTLDHVSRLAVESFADWCVVDIMEGVEARRIAVRHRNPDLAAVMEKLHAAPTPASNPLIYEVIRKRVPIVLESIPQELVENVSPERREIYRQAGSESLMIVPLVSREAVLGAITFVSARPDRRYGQRELQVATELAKRCAVAIENARLYAASQDAGRAKDEFLAVVSHELRTPMTAILGWVGMLQLGETDPETLKLAIDSIGRAARAQAGLVEDLLDVSRIVTGKLSLDRVTTTVAVAVQRAIEMVGPAASARDIEIDVFSSGPVQFIDGDPARLQQVFLNLLSNAVKFTPRYGRIEIRIDHPGPNVRVAISDSGCGIDPGFIPFVFDRFTQEKSSTTRAYNGMGLGLSIARSIVDMHGGTIVATSEGEGRGCTFTVTIPAIAETTVMPSSERISVELPSLAGVHILAIDDDVHVRELLERSLPRSGARVTTAEDAASGLQQFLEHKPDVVLSDIAMPGEDGLSLIAKLRLQDDRRTPAIAVTAYMQPEGRDRVLAAGYDEMLRKPLDPSEIVRTIHRVMRAKRLTAPERTPPD